MTTDPVDLNEAAQVFVQEIQRIHAEANIPAA